MTNRALALINAFATQRITDVLGEFDRPCHLIGIDVENSRVSIKGGTAPLRAAVKTGKDNGVLSRAQRDELPFAAIASKLLQRPLVPFRSTVGEHVLR